MATQKQGLLITSGSESQPPGSTHMGFFSRFGKAVQFLVQGGNVWMGPGQPLQPTQQNLDTRRFDYPVSVNTVPIPASQRRDTGDVSYFELRAMADSYDLLRGVIEMRKNQISGMKWQLIDPTRDQDTEVTEREQEGIEFLKHPSADDTWESWIRKIVEDLLVVDSVACFPIVDSNMASDWRLIDGGTIKKLFNAVGDLPVPPSPAYQQIIKGVPMRDMTTDELVLRHMNPRNNKMYGFPPVEQVVMSVNIALRRQLFQLEYYTQGTIPDALATAPETWSPEDIRAFQTWFDSVMTGSSDRRKLKFLPVDATKVKVLEKKDLTDKTDEWLARVICFVFGVEPTALVSMMNRATAEKAHDVALEAGVGPILKFLEGLINDLLIRSGMEDLQFSWDRTPDMDPAEQSKVYAQYIQLGVYSVDEVRVKLGLPELGIPPMVYTAQGPVPLTAFVDAKPASSSQGESTPGAGAKIIPLRGAYNKQVSKFYKRRDGCIYRPFDQQIADVLGVGKDEDEPSAVDVD